MAKGDYPLKNTHLLGNSNLFSPSVFPFIYLPVSCKSTTNDLVVPEIGEAIEDKLKQTKTKKAHQNK